MDDLGACRNKLVLLVKSPLRVKSTLRAKSTLRVKLALRVKLTLRAKLTLRVKLTLRDTFAALGTPCQRPSEPKKNFRFLDHTASFYWKFTWNTQICCLKRPSR